MAAFLRSVAVGDSAFCSQVDVSSSNDHPTFNNLVNYPQMGEFHGMFPSVLQGGRGPSTRRIQHALEAHGIVAGGKFVSRDDYFSLPSFQEATDKFFDDTDLEQCIDDLHAAVVDAKLRKQKGEVRPDIWREDLHPRDATRARTVPLLEREKERLFAELQEVASLTSIIRNHSLIPARGRESTVARRDHIQRPSIRRK